MVYTPGSLKDGRLSKSNASAYTCYVDAEAKTIHKMPANFLRWLKRVMGWLRARHSRVARLPRIPSDQGSCTSGIVRARAGSVPWLVGEVHGQQQFHAGLDMPHPLTHRSTSFRKKRCENACRPGHEQVNCSSGRSAVTESACCGPCTPHGPEHQDLAAYHTYPVDSLPPRRAKPMRSVLVFLLPAVGLLGVAAAKAPVANVPGSPRDRWPVGIDKRIPWTSSHVVGSPNPPLPFRVKPAFPKLKIPTPIGVANEPGSDRLLIIHQDWAWGGQGRIVRIKDDPAVDKTEPILTIDGIAYGVAFHPDFAKNGYMYVGYNGPYAGDFKYTRVSRYTLLRQAPYTIVPGSEKRIIEWESDGHNGGDVAFGHDGMLYVTSGDGTSDSDTEPRRPGPEPPSGQGAAHRRRSSRARARPTRCRRTIRSSNVPGRPAGNLGLRLAQSLARAHRQGQRRLLGRPERPGPVGAGLPRAEGRQLRLERRRGQPSVLPRSQGRAARRSSSRPSSTRIPRPAR